MVKFARKLKIKQFWATHISIAPVLALIHLNFFSVLQTGFKIKQIETEFLDSKNSLFLLTKSQTLMMNIGKCLQVEVTLK